MLLRKVWRGRRWKEGCEEQRTCGRSMGGIPRGANASCSWFTIGMSSFSGIFGDFRPGLPVFSASLPSTLPLFQKAREYTGTKQEEFICKLAKGAEQFLLLHRHVADHRNPCSQRCYDTQHINPPQHQHQDDAAALNLSSTWSRAANLVDRQRS